MSDGVTLRIETAEVIEWLRDSEPLAVALGEAMEAARVIGQKAAEEGLDGGTGLAVRSVFSDAQAFNMKVGTTLPRARALSIDKGRPSGTPVRKLLGQIIRWKDSVGIDQSGWAVAEGISRRGARGRFFRRAALQAVEAELPRLIRIAERRFEGLKS